MKQVLLVLVLVLGGLKANACTVTLGPTGYMATSRMSLCEAWDRYYMATYQMKAKGIATPRRVGNLMAPRFINMPDWMGKRTADADSATKIYAPAPTTWTQWENGASVVDTKASENFKHRLFPAIDLSWIMGIHKIGLKNLVSNAGQFRKSGEVGVAFYARNSMTRKQIEALTSLPFHRQGSNEKLITFQPLACLEHQSKEYADKQAAAKAAGQSGINAALYEPVANSKFFKGADGQEHQCGLINYSQLEAIPEQLNLLVNYVNTSTTRWSSGYLPQDPLTIAANVQRWFIAIHPFSDGNGRVSRFLMDLLIESLGLPAPLLGDMNYDLYTTDQQWRDEIGRGIARAVVAAESCARSTNGLGCAVIAQGVAQ